MSHNIVRTKIPDHLKALPKLTQRTWRKYRSEHKSPNQLIELASTVVDELPVPDCWSWSSNEVADWIDIQHSYTDYKEAFKTNLISGQILILLEADKLPQIGIRNFSDVKKVSEAIRNLYKVDAEEFKRSINLPIRRPETLYLWYRARHDGPVVKSSTRSEFFRRTKITRGETTENAQYFSILNHWQRISPFRSWCPRSLIGGIQRVNPMTGTRQRTAQHASDPPFLLKDLSVWVLEYESDEDTANTAVSSRATEPRVIRLPTGESLLLTSHQAHFD